MTTAGLRGIIFVAAVAGAMTGRSTWAATGCRTLQYSFEPDCFVRDATGRCQFDLGHPDFGPQIAVWVEAADGSTFVDTVMVTNAVALYGIGNRPGRWDFRSGPRYGYGRRPMALPVWAHRRGVLYPSLVMNDGFDDSIGAHAEVSSPEPHFCRPMLQTEIVDAITCASGLFRSAKGIFDPAGSMSYYPPRGDLIDWADLCVPLVSAAGTACDYGDARQFGLLNDTDAIAAATPRYDQGFTGTWAIPSTLAGGDYAFMVEVGKEFDANAPYMHSSYLSPYETVYYSQYGFDDNVGQPSVVYRIPFHLSATPLAATATSVAWGYGDWTGDSGALSPMDATISVDPGSGEGRLRASDGPGGSGRLHLGEVACAPRDCAQGGPPEQPPIDAPPGIQPGTSARFSFKQVSDGGGRVIAYELRYAPVGSSFLQPVDESGFARWTPADAPPVATPGTVTEVTLDSLGPDTDYAVGLRARGACGWSNPTFARVITGSVAYKRLSGCVIATAAYGSDLAPEVALLRRARDRAAARFGVARLAAVLYGETAPPLAALVGRSEVAREAVRGLLRPLVAVNRAILTGSPVR